MQKAVLKKHLYPFFIFFIISFGIFLRLKCFLLNPSMWHDECALGWNIYAKTYAQFFGRLDFTQMAPPFFLVLTKSITKLFGFSDMSLRLIPFLAGCLSVGAFYLLAQICLKTKPAILWAVFLFAINMRLIGYSIEFKPYSLDVLFCIICLIFFLKLDLSKFDYKKIFAVGTVLSFIPWLTFASVFVIAGGIAGLLSEKKENDYKKILCFLLPMAISGGLYFKFYLSANLHNGSMFEYWQKIFVTNPKFFAILFYENIKYFFSNENAFFTLSLVLLGGIKFYKEKAKFLKFSFLILLFTTLAFFIRVYPFLERMILFLVPVFIIFVAKAVEFIPNKQKTFSIFVIFLLVIFSIPQVFLANKIVTQKKYVTTENPRKLFEIMMRQIKNDDVICINKASDTEFAYYSIIYKPKNKAIKDFSPEKTKLPKARYWIYLPYDEAKQPNSEYILPWMEHQKIIKSYTDGISKLFYIQVG